MPFLILKNIDVTTLEYDAIVNAANKDLLCGGGVCGAIFAKAGYENLTMACKKLSPVKPGYAVITPGFNLKAKYIIHAVGPIYMDGNHDEESTLSSCYQKALDLAYANQIHSIAFPLISSGIYGYPYHEAYKVAKKTILDFLKENDCEMTIALSLFGDIPVENESIISKAFEKPKPTNFMMARCCCVNRLDEQLTRKIETTKESFTTLLFRYIDDSGMSDSEFYHKANMDRRLFSKLKDENHRPSKNTVLSSSIALRLSLNDTEKLLNTAGYTLSDSLLSDCIIKYCIQNKEYDIYNVNDILFHYNQPILG